MTTHEARVQTAPDAVREMMAQARPDQIRRLLDDVRSCWRGEDSRAGGSA